MLLTQKSGQSITWLRIEISGCRSLFDGIALACGRCTRRFWGSLRDRKHVGRRQETTRKHIILNASRLHTKTKHAGEWFQGCLLIMRAILHPDEVLLWLAKEVIIKRPFKGETFLRESLLPESDVQLICQSSKSDQHCVASLQRLKHVMRNEVFLGQEVYTFGTLHF